MDAPNREDPPQERSEGIACEQQPAAAVREPLGGRAVPSKRNIDGHSHDHHRDVSAGPEGPRRHAGAERIRKFRGHLECGRNHEESHDGHAY